MRPPALFLVASSMLILTSTPAWPAQSETGEPDPMKMWSCPQPDGSDLYTNKERPGCTLMALKPLSVVPSLDNMPTYRSSVETTPYHVPSNFERDQIAKTGRGQTVPDWARDWHASIASTGSVQGEVCSMYGEWLLLSQKTRGGFFFGSDPSYGGDISGWNQRGPSFSYFDNARYVALSKVFGQGFVPIGCW